MMSHLIVAVHVQRVRDLRCVEPVAEREQGTEPVFVGTISSNAVDLDAITRREDRRLVEQSIGRIDEPHKCSRDLSVRKRDPLAQLDGGSRVIKSYHSKFE